MARQPDPDQSRRLLNVRTRTRPAAVSKGAPGCTPPDEEHDLALYELVGLDKTGRPMPQDDGRGPSIGLQLLVSRNVADRLLRDAITAVDAMLGPGFAKRHPEMVITHMQIAMRFGEDMRRGDAP